MMWSEIAHRVFVDPHAWRVYSEPAYARHVLASIVERRGNRWLVGLVALALALAGCVVDEPNEPTSDEPVYNYDCAFTRSCGERGWTGHLRITDTVDNVREIGDGWLRGCQALTASDVGTRCYFVLCVYVCTGADDEGAR